MTVTASDAALVSPTSSVSSTSPSATSEPYKVKGPEDVDIIDIFCPTNALVSRPYNKEFSCTNGQTIQGKGTDITGLISYSLQTCVDACSTYNDVNKDSDVPKCVAVVLGSGMKTDYAGNKGANCWLKNTAEGNRVSLDSATLAILKQ